jgi:hypothetical protein
MIRVAANTRRFLAVPVVAIAIVGTVYLGPTAAEMLDGLTRHIIEFPRDVLRGFQRFSPDRFDPTYDESPWLLSPTLEAL